MATEIFRGAPRQHEQWLQEDRQHIPLAVSVACHACCCKVGEVQVFAYPVQDGARCIAVVRGFCGRVDSACVGILWGRECIMRESEINRHRKDGGGQGRGGAGGRDAGMEVCRDGKMDGKGWMGWRMMGRMDGRTDGGMNGWMDGWMSVTSIP